MKTITLKTKNGNIWCEKLPKNTQIIIKDYDCESIEDEQTEIDEDGRYYFSYVYNINI